MQEHNKKDHVYIRDPLIMIRTILFLCKDSSTQESSVDGSL